MTKTIETEHVVIRSIAVSDMANNVYLITAKESGAQVLIDAADDADAIKDLIASGGPRTPRQNLSCTRSSPHTSTGIIFGLFQPPRRSSPTR